MGIPQFSSSLSFQLRIIEAKNLGVKPTSNVFVRYYLSTGNNNKRIQLNTKQTSSKSQLYCFDESFSLECFGDEDSMHKLKQQSVVFELRQRTKVGVLGMVGRSRLIGRAEVMCSDDMEMDKWVPMASRCCIHGDAKPPALRIQMKVASKTMVAETERTKRYKNLKMHEKCGCQYGGCECVDYEAFALIAALEAL